MHEPSPNPYAPPSVSNYPSPVSTQHPIASLGLRFCNLLLDYLLGLAPLWILSGAGFSLLGGLDVESEESPALTVVTYVIFFGYYIIMEGACGRTVGKFITGTKVVMADGSKLTMKHAFFRALCRIIPFDAFSIFRNSQLAWHDTIPGTMVVNVRRQL